MFFSNNKVVNFLAVMYMLFTALINELCACNGFVNERYFYAALNTTASLACWIWLCYAYEYYWKEKSNI